MGNHCIDKNALARFSSRVKIVYIYKENVMTNQIQKNGINPILAAVGGAVVGAGLVVAGAAALKNKAVHKKIEKGVNSLEGKADDFSEKVEQGVDDLTAKTRKVAEQVSQQVSAKTRAVKEDLEEKAEKLQTSANTIKKAIDKS